MACEENEVVKEGERILLVMEDGSEYLIRLKKGTKFGTHLGILNFDDLIGKKYGSSFLTTKGKKVYVIKPGIVENIMKMKRKTQIVYPKDMGYILLKLDIKEGDRVIDVGVGSGAMCGAIARLVGKIGKVYGYDRREDFLKLAENNLKEWGLLDRVILKNKDISEGFDEKNVDALFLDVPNPWDHIDKCWEALKGGGRIAIVCPTTNQVQEVLKILYKNPFINVEVWESLFRMYKPVHERFRPVDRMVAHTAYMIFAIKVFER